MKNKRIILIVALLAIALVAGIFTYPKLFKNDTKVIKKNEGVILGLKELNYAADLPIVEGFKSDSSIYTIEELEEKLEIKFLRNNYFEYGRLMLNTLEKVDGSISNLSLSTQYNKSIYPKRVEVLTAEISCVTKYNFKIKEIETQYYGAGSVVLNYKIRSLNVRSNIRVINEKEVGSKLDKVLPSIYRVNFSYDNVGYTFTILVRYDEEVSKIDIVKDFLESFSYR